MVPAQPHQAQRSPGRLQPEGRETETDRAAGAEQAWAPGQAREDQGMAMDRAATAGQARESARARMGTGPPCSVRPAGWHPLAHAIARLQ